MDMLCSESEDYQKHGLGLYGMVRNFVGIFPYHHLITPSPPKTPFCMIRLLMPRLLLPRRYGKSKSIDQCVDEGRECDLDRRVIASLKDDWNMRVNHRASTGTSKPWALLSNKQ
jgi:hypothetical protein